MFGVRQKLLVALAGLIGLAAALPARAESIYEPNDSAETAFPLPAKQLVVTDDLDGNAGRPDTILGHFDPTYTTLMDINDNATPGVGNGFGSQLLDVPLHTNGSVYFGITGAPDSTFASVHDQLGEYSVTYQVYSPAHVLEKTVFQTEAAAPNDVDSAWLDPDLSLSDWTGYIVDVTVNNVYGPGEGDSLDFYVFSGIQPSTVFTARLIDVEFDGLIGLYDDENQRVATSVLVDGVPTLTGLADIFGSVKLGVTGQGDDGFIGEHAKTGQYTLALDAMLVPEPEGGVLLIAGLAVIWVFWQCRRRSRQARTADPPV